MFAAAVVLLVVLLVPAAAHAEDPPLVNWATLSPALATGSYEPSSENDCVAGRLKCVDHVLREMNRRFEPLASSCDHNSIFALSYLRTTEEYRRATTTPGFFEDPEFVNHEDAVFAGYYFDAYDDWKAGRRSRVPQAWLTAFDAARDQRVSATGNLTLGINAHVNRDLPYVLYGIGLVKPDGSTRKTDHDKVNEFLNRVTDDLFAEIARRFDPTIDDGNAPGWVDDIATFQSIPMWREAAWRNAERLANAPDAESRERVKRDIEAYAATQATMLQTATAYSPLGGGAAARNAFCAANWNS